MSRSKLSVAIVAALVLGALIGGLSVYFAFGASNARPVTERNWSGEIAKWRQSSIEWETAMLRHTVQDVTYEPTKKYMSERIAIAERFLADKITFDQYIEIANELDEHARNNGLIHVVGGEDFGYRMQ